MSLYDSKGYTPFYAYKSIQGAGAVQVQATKTSTRIVLTDLVVAHNLGGTVQFRFGNVGGTKVVEFNMGGSSTVAATLNAENTVMDQALFVEASACGTDGVQVTATGFHID